MILFKCSSCGKEFKKRRSSLYQSKGKTAKVRCPKCKHYEIEDVLYWACGNKIDFDAFDRPSLFDYYLFFKGGQGFEFQANDFHSFLRLFIEWCVAKGRRKKDIAGRFVMRALKTLCPSLRNIEDLIGQLSHFEDIIIVTRAGLQRKFYRDHLNHMVRVMLLSNAITTQLSNLLPSERDITDLATACLLHDIAYPIQESANIYDSIKDALGKYRLIRWPDIPSTYRYNLKPLLLRLWQYSKFFNYIIENKRFDLIEKYDHGLLGALEFLEHRGRLGNQRSAQILDTIGLHQFSDVEVRFSEYPLAALLILCDDLQDWGRSTGYMEEITLYQIDDFSYSYAEVKGTFKYQDIDGFSCLQQVHGKKQNLQRLVLDKSFPGVDIRFNLQAFNLTHCKDLIRTVAKFIEADSAKLLYNWRESIGFSKKEQVDDLLELMKDLPSVSAWVGPIYIYYRPDRSEFFVVRKKNPVYIKLATDKRGRFHTILGDTKGAELRCNLWNLQDLEHINLPYPSVNITTFRNWKKNDYFLRIARELPKLVNVLHLYAENWLAATPSDLKGWGFKLSEEFNKKEMLIVHGHSELKKAIDNVFVFGAKATKSK